LVNQGEVFRFMAKPWRLGEEFRPAVREAIEYYNLQKERARLAEKVEPHEPAEAKKALDRSDMLSRTAE